MSMFELIPEAFKEVPTHLPSGRPNQNHPAYATHKAAYDKQIAANRQPRQLRVKPEDQITASHYHSAFDSVPDMDPHDVVMKLSRKLNMSYDDVTRGLNRHARSDGHKTYSYAYYKMAKDFKDGEGDLGFTKQESISSRVPMLVEAIRDMLNK
jgi:hypothetical protein